jgi:hypothetical protein
MMTQMHCFTNAGTRQQSEVYRAGKKLTKFVLEILNLQRKEDLTIDLVSNQDFSEVIYIRCLHIFIPQTLNPKDLAASWKCIIWMYLVIWETTQWCTYWISGNGEINKEKVVFAGFCKNYYTNWQNCLQNCWLAESWEACCHQIVVDWSVHRKWFLWSCCERSNGQKKSVYILFDIPNGNRRSVSNCNKPSSVGSLRDWQWYVL